MRRWLVKSRRNQVKEKTGYLFWEKTKRTLVDRQHFTPWMRREQDTKEDGCRELHRSLFGWMSRCWISWVLPSYSSLSWPMSSLQKLASSSLATVGVILSIGTPQRTPPTCLTGSKKDVELKNSKQQTDWFVLLFLICTCSENMRLTWTKWNPSSGNLPKLLFEAELWERLFIF